MTTRDRRLQLREYQWNAVVHLSRRVGAGDRRLGLSAPTGSGKTVILHAFMAKTRPLFTGVLVAAPSLATEAAFHKSVRVKYDAGYAEPGHTRVRDFEVATSMFVYPNKEDVAKRDELATFLTPAGHERPFFLTTHMQLTSWGTGVLPPDLSGKVLVLDEAHHAGTDAEAEQLNTEVGNFATAWYDRGGTVVYSTATPYRADELDVFPEGTDPYAWSIAEHAASGHAPTDFCPSTVAVDVEAHSLPEFFGDAGGVGGADVACAAMVGRWVADGKPKAVFILPAGVAGRAEAWGKRLALALAAASPSVRVVNAVDSASPDEQAKVEFLAALAREADVERYADSTVDVFLACKRFDEGTDWPLCSHVYNWGVPSSFGLILQRWGRTFRCKKRYADYPEAHRACAQVA